jgi:hypothetical protein
MKTNGQMVSSGIPGLIGIDPNNSGGKDYRATWALYYSKFIAAYQNAGIKVFSAFLQNLL